MQKILNILFFVMSAISYGQVTVLTDVNTKEPKQNEPVVLTIVQEVVGENMVQESRLQLMDLSKFDIVPLFKRNYLYLLICCLKLFSDLRNSD